MSEEQVPAQKVVYVQESKAMSFTFAQLAPWVLMIAILAYFLGRGNVGTIVPDSKPAPVPTPVVPAEKTVVDRLDEILEKKDGLYLSAVCQQIAVLVQKDGESSQHLLNNTKDVHNLINVSGRVITLDHGPYNGLGAILATYFDEEAEFPQKVGELTPEARTKAVSNFQKMSEDLAKVK